MAIETGIRHVLGPARGGEPARRVGSSRGSACRGDEVPCACRGGADPPDLVQVTIARSIDDLMGVQMGQVIADRVADGQR